MQQAAGIHPIRGGMNHHDSAELIAIVTVLTCLARKGTARWSRQLRTIGPIVGWLSNQFSQRLLPRAKQ